MAAYEALLMTRQDCDAECRKDRDLAGGLQCTYVKNVVIDDVKESALGDNSGAGNSPGDRS